MFVSKFIHKQKVFSELSFLLSVTTLCLALVFLEIFPEAGSFSVGNKIGPGRLKRGKDKKKKTAKEI